MKKALLFLCAMLMSAGAWATNLDGKYVKAVGSAVQSLDALTEGYYAVFDANSERWGYLTLTSAYIGYDHTMSDGATISSTDYAIYVAKDGDNYTFRLPNDKYIPAVSQGASLTADAASETAVGFVVTLLDDEAFTFNVKNTADDMYWNANSGSSITPLCGWTGAHPIKFYPLTIEETAGVEFDYTVTVLGSTDAAAGITYKGTTYGNGDTFAAADLQATDLTAAEVTGDNATFTINGTAVTVVYTPDLTDMFVLNTTVETTTDPIVEGQWYVLTQLRGGESAAYDAGTGSTLRRASTTYTADYILTYGTEVSSIDKYLIRFIKSGLGDAWNIQFANGNFWNGMTSSATQATSFLVYNATQSADGTTGWALNATTDGTDYANKVDNNAAGNTLSYWGTGMTESGGNNVWKIYPASIGEAPAYDITVNIKNGEDVVATTTFSALAGIDYQVADLFPASGVTYDPEGFTTTTAAQTINVTYTYTSPFPFKENATYADIDQWYYLQIRPDTKLSYVVYTGGTPNVACPTAMPTHIANAKWAFIGSTDPFIGKGLTLVNKAAGEGLILAADSPQGDGGTGKNTYGTMETAGTKTYEVWYAETSTSGTNGFYLRNADNDYFNLRSNANLAFWTGGHDVGSTFVVVDPATVDKEILAQDIALGSTYKDQLGEGYGKYTGATAEEIDLAIAAATAVYLNDEATLAEVDAQIEALMAIAEKIEINTPAANSFLRIKGHSTGLYVQGSATAGAAAPSADAAATDGTDIWYYGADKCLVNYATGLGLIGTKYVADITETKETTTFRQSHSTATDATVACVYEILSNFDGSQFWYSNTSNLDRNSVNNNAKCEWDLEAVTELPVAVTAAGYATLYAPVALTIPAGVEAFAVSAIANDEATLTAVETTIPANTAVILKAAEGAYTFAIAESDATVENKLDGTVPAIEWTDEFTLQNSDAGVGLFSKEVAHLAGFKAYLPASEVPAGVKGVKFDIETAVKAIEAAQEAGEIMYDLNGRRIFKAQKGVYIINGKKVAIK